MKAYELQSFDGPNGLKLVERNTPAPAPGQVLIRVHAASLNYRDPMLVKGQYNPNQPLPLIPLSDGAGDINPLPILRKARKLSGILVASRKMFEDMNRAIALSGLRPIVDRVFAFDEAPQVLAYLQSGSHFGKIVIRM